MSSVSTTTTSSSSSIIFSDEQKYVIQKAIEGESFFLTGTAGSGKSLILKEIKDRLINKEVYITGTTGVSALNVGGSTFHSFIGAGLANGSKEEVYRRVVNNFKANKRWNSVHVVILDECSMLSADLLEKADYVARNIRNGKRNVPFGGIQLILVGDMLQLPPVDKDKDQKSKPLLFECEAFRSIISSRVYNLTKIYRQDEDPLITMLNHLRMGTIKYHPKSILFMKSLARPLNMTDGIEPVRLFSKNVDVDIVNNTRLNALSGIEKEYKAMDSGDKYIIEKLNEYCNAPALLKLKINAQVMLLYNDANDKRLVNGTQGVVVAFDLDTDFPIVRFEQHKTTKTIAFHKWAIEDKRGHELASRNQVGLRLSWAITIHKAQSLTLDKVQVHGDECFEDGQFFVACSRARTSAGLQIVSFQINKIKVNPKIKEFYESIPKIISTINKREREEEDDEKEQPQTMKKKTKILDNRTP